jgi:hypothetical protein
MRLYLQKVMSYLNIEHKIVSITRIPRENNQQADLLSKLASFNFVKFSADVWVEVVEEPNVDKNELVVIPINKIDDWRILIRDYLQI